MIKQVFCCPKPGCPWTVQYSDNTLVEILELQATLCILGGEGDCPLKTDARTCYAADTVDPRGPKEK